MDNIWNGKRDMFMSSCGQELAAVRLLSNFDLNPENIQNLVKSHDVDLDVADSRGNTRLMISSVLNVFFLRV